MASLVRATVLALCWTESVALLSGMMRTDMNQQRAIVMGPTLHGSPQSRVITRYLYYDSIHKLLFASV